MKTVKRRCEIRRTDLTPKDIDKKMLTKTVDIDVEEINSFFEPIVNALINCLNKN